MLSGKVARVGRPAERALAPAGRPQHAPQVTFVLPDGMSVGGVTSWTVRLASELAARGTRAQIVEHVDPAAIDHGVPKLVPRRRIHTPRPFFPTEREVHRYAPAYGAAIPGVIVPNYSAGAYAACAALSSGPSRGSRTIGFAHSDSDHFYELLAYYEPIIHRFVAVSDVVAERLHARLPWRQEDITMRPYGVHVASDLRRSHSSRGEPLRLVYAGRLIQEQKRVLDLVPIVRSLAAQDVEFDLLVVGEGVARAELERRLARLSLPPRSRVRVRGALPHREMDSVWATADVCVLVSAFEGTSLAMLEAMAAGCVPVVTDVSGARMHIRPGANGFTVPVGATEEMARVISTLARRREQLPLLGSRARRSAAECSLASYAEWFSDLLAETWGQPPRTWPGGLPLIPPPGVWGPRPIRLGGRMLAQSSLYGVARRRYRSLCDQLSVLVH